MKSGYKVEWTDNALEELQQTFDYLESNFTEKELNKLAVEIEQFVALISKNPTLFPASDIKDIRKVVIKKYNTMYYRILEDKVEILSFFSNRQNPKKRKLF